MFDILKPIIGKNESLEENIVDLCKSVLKEIKEIEESNVNNWTQDRLDNIKKFIDDLESDDDFTLDTEIDDLKEEFHTLDKSLEVYTNYKAHTYEVMQVKLDTFFKWSN